MENGYAGCDYGPEFRDNANGDRSRGSGVGFAAVSECVRDHGKLLRGPEGPDRLRRWVTELARVDANDGGHDVSHGGDVRGERGHVARCGDAGARTIGRNRLNQRSSAAVRRHGSARPGEKRSIRSGAGKAAATL